MADRTLIQGAYVIAFDGREHRLLRDGVVVVEGNRILHVGSSFEGRVHRRIDASHHVVTPGLISAHAHIAGSPLDKSLLEDRGNPQFYLSGLFEFLPVRAAAQDEEGTRACVDFSICELLRSGCTTVMEMGPAGDYVAERVGALGMRAYIAQNYRSGSWRTPDGRQVVYEWSEDDGRAAMERAVEFVRRVDGSHGGRVRGFLTPSQVDTCSERLLRESRRVAEELGVPLQTHVSQSVNEFQEMLRRHGKTPLAWLRDIGFLGPGVFLVHCIVVGGTSWANYPPGDVRILAESGATVAHAPWVFARRGMVLESFGRYRDAGVRLTLGTDTSPQSMLLAMRWAAICGKVVDRTTELLTARDIFDAATLGAARALGRDDLGRLAPGALADLLIWDTRTIGMAPLRDPIKNIVYSAERADLRTVMVNGKILIEDGVMPGVDEAALARSLQAAAERMWPRMQRFDWAARDVDQLSPQTYAPWDG